MVKYRCASYNFEDTNYTIMDLDLLMHYYKLEI